MSCANSGIEKHPVLKARGFCFTEAQAIRNFQQRRLHGSRSNRVSLTSADRQLMARIIAQKMKLCHERVAAANATRS